MKIVFIGLFVIAVGFLTFDHMYPNRLFSHQNGQPEAWEDTVVSELYRSPGYSTVTGEELTTMTKEAAMKYYRKSYIAQIGQALANPTLSSPRKKVWQLTVENNDLRNPAISQGTVDITGEVIKLTQECGVRYDLTFQSEKIVCPPEFGGNSQITIEKGYYGTWSKGALTGEIALTATNEDGTYFEGYWWNTNSNKEQNRFSHRVILELK